MPDNETWKPIGEVIKDLREKTIDALSKGNPELAETYHQRALDLEIDQWLRGADDE